MLRFFIIILGLASYAACSDHTLFKTCAQIPFCETLRNYKQSSPFKADISKFRVEDNVVIIPLNNAENISLNLQIAFLMNRTARVQIEETDKTRFELIYVLERNPEKIRIKGNLTVNSLTLAPYVTTYTQRVVIKTTDTSFDVEFYYNNILEFVLKGDRLVFQKDSNAFAFATQFNATHLYGLHHHAVDLELPATVTGDEGSDPYRNRNSDNDHYEINSRMALYGSIPVIYGHSKDQTYGIFLHNAAEQWIDISVDGEKKKTSYFMVESGLLDFFVLFGNTPKDVVRQYTGLTGVAHMPQLWTLGYHQCRWSYLTQDITKDVVANMDLHNFPMDAIWLDIDYTDGKRYFTWDPVHYSDPEDLQRNLSSTNRKLVTILDPHIKVDKNYPVYVGAKDKYFVKLNNTDYTGDCWPGESSYIDFLNPKARDYYASWYHYDKFTHSTPTLAGVWNDMNEPSVFDNTIEKTLPFDSMHDGNVPHRDIHNIYGFLHTMATHQGLMERDNNQIRPFILTRSHFAGSQRYAAMWTGDNTADWPYLKLSYSECLLSNVLGHVFCGADVGGFFGETTEELIQRWHQAGIWLPFYRGHAENTTKNREPYVFTDKVQDVIRKAMIIRYKHIPVWYTLFYEHTRTGEPIIRPFFYEYPGTTQSEHLLLGSHILARPVMEEGATNVTVNFPGGRYTYWYRVDDELFEVYSGGSSQKFDVDINTSPYFYKGGSIIARKETERKSTTEMQNDPFTLYVNLDTNGAAAGTLYVDDYTSFKYQNEQLYFYAKLIYTNDTGALQVEIIDGNGLDFEVDLQQIIIHEISSTGDGQYKRTVHTHLSDGTPLKGGKLMEKVSKENKVILNL